MSFDPEEIAQERERKKRERDESEARVRKQNRGSGWIVDKLGSLGALLVTFVCAFLFTRAIEWAAGVFGIPLSIDWLLGLGIAVAITAWVYWKDRGLQS